MTARHEAITTAAVKAAPTSDESLAGRVGAATQIVDGDLLKPETLEPSVAGVETAYYVGV